MVSSNVSGDWKYPYLVTASPEETLPTQSNNGSLSNLLEDIEMGEPEPQFGRKYIALDTNILIDHLNLVRQFYTVLNSPSSPNHSILIPSIVINELDKLKTSLAPAGTTPDGPVTKGDLAKAATRWLLDINQTKRDLGYGSIRFQKWSEHNNPNLIKGDDKILDCCLFFTKTSHVTLWTNDQNLLLLAESNDVQTVRGHTSIRLEHILRDLDIETDIQQIKSLRTNLVPVSILYDNLAEDEMELDDEYLPSPDASTLPTPTISKFRSSQTSTSLAAPITTPHSTTDRTILRPTTRPPTQLLDRLTTMMTTILTVIRPNTTIDNDIHTILRTCTDFLLELEKTTERPSDTNMQLLQCISALRTISTFTRTDTTIRRPRIGQVADAVESLGTNFRLLGIFGDDADFRLLATDIRVLP